MDDLAILVPLKDFAVAKSRLRHGGIEQVDEVVRALARGVFEAASPRPLVVASDSTAVSAFARECGVEVIESPISGLNASLTHAYHELGERFRRLTIAHGDIRNPLGLGTFEPRCGVTVIADAHRTGTNVLALPTGHDFTFKFGPNSARAHTIEARRLGLDVWVDYDSPWRFDVDEPRDLVQ